LNPCSLYLRIKSSFMPWSMWQLGLADITCGTTAAAAAADDDDNNNNKSLKSGQNGNHVHWVLQSEICVDLHLSHMGRGYLETYIAVHGAHELYILNEIDFAWV